MRRYVLTWFNWKFAPGQGALTTPGNSTPDASLLGVRALLAPFSRSAKLYLYISGSELKPENRDYLIATLTNLAREHPDTYARGVTAGEVKEPHIIYFELSLRKVSGEEISVTMVKRFMEIMSQLNVDHPEDLPRSPNFPNHARQV